MVANLLITDIKEISSSSFRTSTWCNSRQSRYWTVPNTERGMKLNHYLQLLTFAKCQATLLANIWALHRNEEVFPDPEKFDHERFLKDPQLKKNPWFVPFSTGEAKLQKAKNSHYIHQAQEYA